MKQKNKNVKKTANNSTDYLMVSIQSELKVAKDKHNDLWVKQCVGAAPLCVTARFAILVSAGKYCLTRLRRFYSIFYKFRRGCRPSPR